MTRLGMLAKSHGPGLWFEWSRDTDCSGHPCPFPLPVCPTLPGHLAHTLIPDVQGHWLCPSSIPPGPEKSPLCSAKEATSTYPCIQLPVPPCRLVILPPCISVPGLLDQGSAWNFPEGRRGEGALSPLPEPTLQSLHMEACPRGPLLYRHSLCSTPSRRGQGVRLLGVEAISAHILENPLGTRSWMFLFGSWMFLFVCFILF